MQMESFKDAINRINNQNQGQNSENNFRPEVINSKTPFFGRILPLGGPEVFPFASYLQTWVSYTAQNGNVGPAALIIDPHDQNDKLGALINQIINYNENYRKEHPEFTEDIIKVGYGKYNLAVRRRVTFLGVASVKTQQGQYTDAINPEQQPDIKAYDISNGALTAITELLNPDFPYAYMGQPLFNNEMQFITTGQTMPLNLKFNQSQGGGRTGNWSAQIVSNYLLPAIEFNYMEKDNMGNYKYIPDIFGQRQPTYITNPSFADAVYDQLLSAFQAQQGAQQANPYATGISDNQLPFQNNNGQVNVMDHIQGVTPQAPTQQIAPLNQPAQPAPQAPMGTFINKTGNNQAQGQTAPTSAPVQSQAPVQPKPQAPVQSQAVQQPVQPSTAPQAPVQSSQPTPQTPAQPQVQSQAPDQPQAPASQAGGVDDLLNGSMNLNDFLNQQ